MRRGHDEFLIYHPNAAANGRDAQVDATKAARLKVDLRAAQGTFTVEWYRATDGVAQAGEAVSGGDWRDLNSPWKGHDCVVRLAAGAKVWPADRGWHNGQPRKSARLPQP